MRPISQSLQDHELIVLRIIGEWWEIDLTGENKLESIQKLSQILPGLDWQQELSFLPPEETDALHALVRAGGRLPLAQFYRQFGEIREMGPAALAREEPWLAPANPAEDLWYRGLIYKGFDETPEGVVEFIYLPDEFLAAFAGEETVSNSDPASEKSPKEIVKEAAPHPTDPSPPTNNIPALTPDFEPLNPPERPVPIETGAVDDVTTILSLAQVNRLTAPSPTILPYLLNQDPNRADMLIPLTEEIGAMRLMPEGYRATRSAVSWLKSDRFTALRRLWNAWRTSDWNELWHHPALICEGSGWYNDPLAARKALLEAIVFSEDWFAIDDVIGKIKKDNPDFQRPNGNYNTWYIRDVKTNLYLNGFEAWDQVEGRLIRFLIEGPLTWLGVVQLAGEAFRLTDRGVSWLNNAPAQEEAIIEEPSQSGFEKLVVLDNGIIQVPIDANRYERFLTGRIASLEPATPGGPYTYRMTAKTLADAQEQGIIPGRVIEFLEKASSGRLPASVRRALERWQEFGTEARLEEVIILRVAKAEILNTLRQHPKTRPYLGEMLGDLSAVVNRDHWPALMAAAAQLGLLLDPL